MVACAMFVSVVSSQLSNHDAITVPAILSQTTVLQTKATHSYQLT